jgi:outer membrane protein
MQKFLRTGLIIASLAIIAFAAAVYVKTGQATAEGELVGFVDSEEIMAGYAPARRAQEAWELFEAQHQKQLEDTIFKKYNTMDLNTLDEAQQAEVRKMFDQADQELKDQFEKIRVQEWEPARNKIQTAIDTVAKEKGVRVVLEKKAVLSGGVDMTADVVAKLK